MRRVWQALQQAMCQQAGKMKNAGEISEKSRVVLCARAQTLRQIEHKHPACAPHWCAQRRLRPRLNRFRTTFVLSKSLLVQLELDRQLLTQL